jgi:hypothetical protein
MALCVIGLGPVPRSTSQTKQRRTITPRKTATALATDESEIVSQKNDSGLA